MLFYFAYVAIFSVAVVWVLGYRVTATVLAAIPVSMWLFGPQLSRALDRVCVAVTKTWRAYARRPGRRYCPACACALRTAKASRPVAGDECPKCEGSWCDSRELLRWLARYGTGESTWRAILRDELSPPRLCPQCAVPLEAGTLDRLQPLFSRCGACGGHWIDRMTWTWFDLTPPPAAAKPPPAAAPTPSRVPELALRKDSSARP